MSPDGWFTLGVILVAVAFMATERAPTPYVILTATTALLLAGVITTQQAFAGFSNPAPFTVAALYVLASAADKTGLLDGLPRLLESAKTGLRGQLFRLLVPTAVASSVLNNTPIVAMIAPTVLSWARRTGRSPSLFLMPISFAAILGGLLTLVGTSTNLVVSGLLVESGHEPMGLFEITGVGLPMAIVGVAYLTLVSPILLPERREPGRDLEADAREFTVEMMVAAKSPLIGETVISGGLRHLEGVFLVEIERRGRLLAPVSPDEPLEESDRLVFVGNIDRILDLQQIPGLRSAEERHFPSTDNERHYQFFEAVVAEGSPLAYSTLKKVDFRARYGAAVLAIHRASERVVGKLGAVILRPGDLLVVMADKHFRERSRDYSDFLVVAALRQETFPRREKRGLVAAVVATLLVAVGFQFLDILRASLAAAIALVVFRVLTLSEAKRAIDMNVLIVIAGSFGLSGAVAASGLDQQIASAVIAPITQWGDTAVLLAVIVTTACLTELVTNNAAAVIMFPIAIAVATQNGLDPRPFALAVALGASASFLSPVGYQTNTMVYAMGGYRFADFARAGLPLTIIMLLVAAFVLPIVWPLR